MQKASAGISNLLHSLRGDGNHSRNIRTVQEAVLKRDVKRVRKILHNCKNEQVIRSALCSAVTLDETSMLQSILDEIKHSISPLHVACSQGKEESVSLLLKAGFTVNVVDEYNCTPLFLAIYEKHRSIADVLLSIDDIDVNRVTFLPPDCLETPLHTVCRLGNIDCVRSLLSCGADVNARNAFRYTPLYVACYQGHTDIVEILLQSGAQINQKADEETPIGLSSMLAPIRECDSEITFAIERCHPEVVSLLISHGAKIDIKLHNNETPLHFACKEGTLDMVKTLVNNGSCINAKTYSGQTPLFYCLRGSPYYSFHFAILNRVRDEESFQEGNDIMEYLIKKGATLSCKDDSGKTPLEHAMMAYRTFSTFILLKYGGRISGEHLNMLSWDTDRWSRTIRLQIANVYLFRLLLRSNFEFKRSFRVYFNILRDISITESFISFLKDGRQPLSLKDQYRISIRHMIYTDTGVQFISSINTLGLPKLLQGFLMLDDFDQSARLPTKLSL